MKENAYEAPERPGLDERRRLIVASVIGVILAGPVAYINFYCLLMFLWMGIYGDDYPIPGWPLIVEPALATLAFLVGVIALRRQLSLAIAWGLFFLFAIPGIFLAITGLRQL